MLTQILHIQPGSASEILKKMEEAGLIIRVPNEIKTSLFLMINRMQEDWQQRFRAVPESTITSGNSLLPKEDK